MNKKVSTLTSLKTLYLDMTDSGKLIGDYILNNPEEIYNIKIEELSQKLNVSPPTVFRLANKLGFKAEKKSPGLYKPLGRGAEQVQENF